MEIDDNIKKLYLDDVDVLKLTKDDVHKRFIENKNNDYCIETNDYIKFIYKEANFVYLGFKDNKVDSFAILYDTNGTSYLRDVNHISE